MRHQGFGRIGFVAGRRPPVQGGGDLTARLTPVALRRNEAGYIGEKEMRAKLLTLALACLLAGVAASGWMPTAMAQSGAKERPQLSAEELNEKYHFCTFPVSNIHFSVQHVNDVIAACSALINSEGGSAENRSLIHLQRGAMYRRLGKFKLALADLTMSIHYDPKSAYAYTGRGNAYRGLHQLDEAIADHTKAIELDPTYAIAYSNRGNAAGRGGAEGNCRRSAEAPAAVKEAGVQAKKPTLRRPYCFGWPGVGPRLSPAARFRKEPRARGTPRVPGALKFTQCAQTKMLGPAGLDASRHRGWSKPNNRKSAKSQGVPRAVF
jgi:hypothetical protein